MMKNNIDGVLIVEGNSDVNFLSSFLEALFFITDGYNLSERKIEFLKETSKVNKLIIMTDSDDAGENIRKRIKNEIEGTYDVFIKPNSRKNYQKCGVAEAIKEDVINALKPYFTNKEIFKEEYDLVSLISLSNNPKKKREEIVNKYHLVDGNNKSLTNQLRILRVKKEELWK